MVSDKLIQTASFELSLPQSEASPAEIPIRGVEKHLPAFLLMQNACWFCRFRWIVIGILATFGVLGLSDSFVAYFGLRPPGLWPFVTAGILTLGNLVFCSRFMSTSPMAVYNLWTQIIMDLIVLTVVVHFVGCLETNISIIYLFHIVLACIFFSHKQSLAVTLLACVMFSACITAEFTEIIPYTTIFAEPPFDRSHAPSTGIFVVDFLSAMGIWLVVWYLTSHLSMMVRKRDTELAETNQRLVAVQEERSQHMLTTTHQLKSPFAAIHTNAELLLKGHCGPLPDEAVDVVRRISARSRRLATEIQEMLQLANLSSARKKTSDWEKVDLAQVLRWSIEQIQPLSLERGVAIETNLESASYVGEGEYLKMLFSNLLANAVNYSYMGGKVNVSCQINNDSKPVVTISDEGIGIPAEKLPHIFNEYYRTTKAVRHNKESSGLGLAIVSQAVKLHGIRLRVKSRPEAGTTFELRF